MVATTVLVPVRITETESEAVFVTYARAPSRVTATCAGEAPTGIVPSTVFVAVLIAETTWAAYAWPANYGNTGNRTFFVNQGGDIVATEDSSYSGTGGGTAPMEAAAAFIPPGSTSTLTGRVATGTVGRDGNFWKQAG